MHKFYPLLVALIALFSVHAMPVSSLADPALREFRRDDFQWIIRQHSQQVFLLLLWSLDCPPCRQELDMLGQFYRHNPDITLVLISTDSITQGDQILAVMQQAGLLPAQQWVFGDESAAALRYAIDPLWYGELPRSYLYQPGQQRQAISGRLSPLQLTRWFVSSTDGHADR